MDKLKKDVENVNNNLKHMVAKMRTPNKLCMDLTLIFILAALIGTLIWVIKKL